MREEERLRLVDRETEADWGGEDRGVDVSPLLGVDSGVGPLLPVPVSVALRCREALREAEGEDTADGVGVGP